MRDAFGGETGYKSNVSYELIRGVRHNIPPELIWDEDCRFDPEILDKLIVGYTKNFNAGGLVFIKFEDVPPDQVETIMAKLKRGVAVAYREFSCTTCGLRFPAPVVMKSNVTTNMSGEMTVYCPHCFNRGCNSSPWRIVMVDNETMPITEPAFIPALTTPQLTEEQAAVKHLVDACRVFVAAARKMYRNPGKEELWFDEPYKLANAALINFDSMPRSAQSFALASVTDAGNG